MSARIWYVALVVGALGCALALSGCAYCKDPAHMKSSRCIAQKVVIACGPELLPLIKDAMPFVLDQNWGGLFAMLEQKAPAEAGCVAEIIGQFVSLQYGASSTAAKAYASYHHTFLIRHGLTNTTFRLPQ